jgi:hypothetical protein
MIDTHLENLPPQKAPGVQEAKDTVRKVKEQRWQQVATEFAQTTDKLGQEIDKGIFETVIALNVLGVHTSQSCEGHLERAIAAPWVDIAAKGGKKPYQQADVAFRTAQQAYINMTNQSQQAHYTEEDIQRLFAEAHRLNREASRPQLEERKKVQALLAEFYQDRQVSYERRIHIQSHNNFSRIESQGAALQDIAEPEEKRLKLLEYQEEMKAFTEFLKNKYFSG